MRGTKLDRLRSLLIAYKAPSVGIVMGYVAIKAPLIGFLMVVTYFTWVIISTRARLRSGRRMQFTPLHAMATFLLFCAGLWGFAAGVVLAAGEQTASVLFHPYLQATIAWLLLWTHASRTAARGGDGGGSSTTVPM